ncbi:hypothetical protein WDU94_010278 [Cyamophila willieti]
MNIYTEMNPPPFLKQELVKNEFLHLRDFRKHFHGASERLGLFNLRKDANVSPRKRTLHNLYVMLQYTLMIISLAAHLFSTITRSVRHASECVQSIFDNSYIILGMYLINYYRTRYEDFALNVLSFMETSFSKADSKIIAQVDRRCKDLVLKMVGTFSAFLCGTYLKSVLPLSAKDLEIRTLVYDTKRPQRRHPYNVRYPFIDESESWAYEIVLVHQTYVCLLTVCMFSLLFSLLPSMMLNVRGQYEMLAKYIRKIGTRHQDDVGHEIKYVNIETNEYSIVKRQVKQSNCLKQDLARRNYVGNDVPNIELEAKEFCIVKTEYDENTRRINQLEKKAAMKRQQDYEQNYLKQIVQFHQKLLVFHEKLLNFYSPILALCIIGATFILSLILYQVILYDPELSLMRRIIPNIQLGIVLACMVFLVNVSEMADDCNTLLRRALVECSWTKCSPQTQRGLCMVLRRVQYCQHMKFYDGAVVVSRVLLVKITKIAYSVVNFVRIRGNFVVKT